MTFEPQTILARILNHKIVAIIRGADPADVLKIAGALYEGGIEVLEITLNSPNALSVIKEVATEMGDKILVGAGTVLDGTSARAAIDAGARFIISPVVDIKTITITRRLGIVSIPGAYTPTEIVNAYTAGGDIIKVFPASGGPRYISDIRGPLPHIPLMPTGGIDTGNIREFQQAGAVAFGIGSALVNTKQEVTDQYLQVLKDKAAGFVRAVGKV